jgi:hypothetical protein
MADYNLAQAGNLSPEDFAQQQQLNRQQQMAQMLMQQSQQPQGQMISGRYVAPSWTQQLAPLANIAASKYIGEKADTEASKLAQKIRESKQSVQQSIMDKINAGDTKGALAIASQNPEYGGKEFVAPLMANVIPKAQEPKVVGNRLVDPTGKVLYTAPKEYAPHAVQIIDTPNGLIQFDPNSRQMTPVMSNGQPLMGSKSALPEAATKQITGATNLKSAIDNYKETLKGFNTFDMVNPDARAGMGNAYNNMMLQAKEAYNLGVLNGPDYQILQSVVKDPTKAGSLLTSKKALDQQATDLGKQADTIITNVYKTHGRNVPANLQNVIPASPSSSGNKAQNFDPALLQYMTPEQQALFGQPGK